MPLPVSGTNEWPPEIWHPAFRKLREYAAWYSGSSAALAYYYGTSTQRRRKNAPFWKFWQRTEEYDTQTREKLHVPLAGDLASVSAALLFSEAPRIEIPDANAQRAAGDAKRAQERLDELQHLSQFIDILIDAAESASALGGVYLMPNWDIEVADHPFVSIVQADFVVPEFRYNRLMAATVWRVVHEENNRVWRHLERHEPGVIEHGLYEGTPQNLGVRRDLGAMDDTAELDEVVVLPQGMQDTLDIEYVPNTRPNRLFRTGVASALGRSDYAGVEGLFDALDEAFTSWMRDIRLGKARILVPEEFLDVRSDGEFEFDLDKEVFTPLAGDPLNNDNNRITPNQFEIRYAEHQATIMDIVDRIVTTAGYSPQTFGINIEGRAESGTALRIRERKSLTTQQRKRRAWEPRLPKLLHNLLIIDREVFGRRDTPVEFMPTVELADSIQPDPADNAATAELLRRAESASTRTLVKMLHPNWTDQEVDEEERRIAQETGRFVEDPMQAGEVA